MKNRTLFLKEIISVFLLLSTFNTIAQDIRISIEEAIEIGINNNAGILSDQIRVEQNSVLSKSGLNNNATQIVFTGEEFGAEGYTGLYSLNVQQNFNLPKAHSIQKEYYLSTKNLAEKQLVLTRKALVKEITKAYISLQYAKQNQELLTRFTALNEDFNRVTKLRFETGETGIIPKVVAETGLMEARLEETNGISDYENARIIFNQWLRTEDNYDVQGELSTSVVLDIDSLFPENPHMLFLAAKNQVASARINQSRAQLLPQINSGLMLQTTSGAFPLFGFQIGINLPLFNKNTKQKIEASELGLKIQEEENREQAKRMRLAIESLMNNMLKKQNTIKQLDESIKPLLLELKDISFVAYQEGEISYLEYLNGFEQLMSMNKRLLKAQYEFHLLKADLEYLLSN
ncbi:MAG: TolC family protein [Saprospiraceae bacterium]|nr:TolC family protein [Saprospiraceae bacterium]